MLSPGFECLLPADCRLALFAGWYRHLGDYHWNRRVILNYCVWMELI